MLISIFPCYYWYLAAIRFLNVVERVVPCRASPAKRAGPPTSAAARPTASRAVAATSCPDVGPPVDEKGDISRIIASCIAAAAAAAAWRCLTPKGRRHCYRCQRRHRRRMSCIRRGCTARRAAAAAANAPPRFSVDEPPLAPEPNLRTAQHTTCIASGCRCAGRACWCAGPACSGHGVA